MFWLNHIPDLVVIVILFLESQIQYVQVAPWAELTDVHGG